MAHGGSATSIVSVPGTEIGAVLLVEDGLPIPSASEAEATSPEAIPLSLLEVCGVGEAPEFDIPAGLRLVRVVGLDITKAQSEDQAVGDILRAKAKETARPSWADISTKSGDYKEWWSEWSALEIIDGVLCRRWISDVDNREVFLPAIPASLQPEVLKHVHDGAGGGHFGREKNASESKSTLLLASTSSLCHCMV